MTLKYEDAKKLADRVVRSLSQLCERIEIAGSIRRKCPEVHDIDIVLITDSLFWPDSILLRLKDIGKVEVIKKGPKLASILLSAVQITFRPNTITMADKPIQVDLYASNKDSWGIHLLRWTGSREYNIKLCNRARNLGMKLAVSKGLLKNGEIIASKTEQDIFDALNMEWVPPEDRN